MRGVGALLMLLAVALGPGIDVGRGVAAAQLCAIPLSFEIPGAQPAFAAATGGDLDDFNLDDDDLGEDDDGDWHNHLPTPVEAAAPETGALLAVDAPQPLEDLALPRGLDRPPRLARA